MSISQQTLISKSRATPLYESIQKSATTRIKAFLCHSHNDENLVRGLVQWFLEYSIDLYIDWMDASMPSITSAETARKIKQEIQNCSVFLFLATSSSMSSVWCPWEIGIADSKEKRIYIIPTKNNLGNYGNEYLDLYPCIDEADRDKRKVLAIFEARKNTGELLNNNNLMKR